MILSARARERQSKPKEVRVSKNPNLAVALAGVWLESSAAYEDALEEIVFVNKPAEGGPKVERAFRRALKSLDAYKILLVVWKLMLEQSGSIEPTSTSYLSGEITAHGLAIAFAETPAEVAKFNSRIRVICVAASGYGLLERLPVSPTRVVLRGTAQLHQFMTEVSARQLQIIQQRLTGVI